MKSFEEFERELADRIWIDPKEWDSTIRIIPRHSELSEAYIEALKVMHDKTILDSFEVLLRVLREYHREYIEQTPDQRGRI